MSLESDTILSRESDSNEAYAVRSMRFSPGLVLFGNWTDRIDIGRSRLCPAYEHPCGSGSGHYALSGGPDNDPVARISVAAGHLRASAEDACRVLREGSPRRKHLCSSTVWIPADTRLQRAECFFDGLLYDGAHRPNPD